jgi:hypothetical protein
LDMILWGTSEIREPDLLFSGLFVAGAKVVIATWFSPNLALLPISTKPVITSTHEISHLRSVIIMHPGCFRAYIFSHCWMDAEVLVGVASDVPRRQRHTFDSAERDSREFRGYASVQNI